eukprot:gnl/MRDRNA2_/MRDRNA2_77795_c0_seq1.p1 gnl/MRDRNA2_/MRDRNA2_77795_c0~~gnl/MRDRNA2_/MRDRNA2_77795_c0_seq1.p1  ORF type:complete len:334 (+),score=45.28 gnl/MRDRNA2_/MRDRNA2_77795_c0_seq1:284-1285(+)
MGSEAHSDQREGWEPIWSVWDNYADCLLHEEFNDHPCMQAAINPQALWQELQPSPEADSVVEHARFMVAIHQVVEREISHLLSGLSLEKFYQARMCMLSRAFGASHIDNPCLVPMADLFNHTWQGDEGAEWLWDEKTREEILISYGLKSNVFLYHYHGFTQSPELEPVWTYMVHPSHCAPIYEHFLPKHLQSVYMLWNSGQVDDSFQVALRSVITNGKNVIQFLHLICARCMISYEKDERLRPALEALARAREKDPASAGWWHELHGTDHQLAHDDTTRVKMSEYLCLMGHLEAVHVFQGSLPEDQCLKRCARSRTLLVNTFRVLQESGYLYP